MARCSPMIRTPFTPVKLFDALSWQHAGHMTPDAAPAHAALDQMPTFIHPLQAGRGEVSKSKTHEMALRAWGWVV